MDQQWAIRRHMSKQTLEAKDSAGQTNHNSVEEIPKTLYLAEGQGLQRRDIFRVCS